MTSHKRGLSASSPMRHDGKKVKYIESDVSHEGKVEPASPEEDDISEHTEDEAFALIERAFNENDPNEDVKVLRAKLQSWRKQMGTADVGEAVFQVTEDFVEHTHNEPGAETVALRQTFDEALESALYSLDSAQMFRTFFNDRARKDWDDEYDIEKEKVRYLQEMVREGRCNNEAVEIEIMSSEGDRCLMRIEKQTIGWRGYT